MMPPETGAAPDAARVAHKPQPPRVSRRWSGRQTTSPGRLRCRHAFEYAVVHANGEVVCSIIDGRGDFVIGNIQEQSLSDILSGPRAQELRAWCSRPPIGNAPPLASDVR